MFLGKSLLSENQADSDVSSLALPSTVSKRGSVTASFPLQISTHLLYSCMCLTFQILVGLSQGLLFLSCQREMSTFAVATFTSGAVAVGDVTLRLCLCNFRQPEFADTRGDVLRRSRTSWLNASSTCDTPRCRPRKTSRRQRRWVCSRCGRACPCPAFCCA